MAVYDLEMMVRDLERRKVCAGKSKSGIIRAIKLVLHFSQSNPVRMEC